MKKLNHNAIFEMEAANLVAEVSISDIRASNIHEAETLKEAAENHFESGSAKGKVWKNLTKLHIAAKKQIKKLELEQRRNHSRKWNELNS